MKPEKQFQIFHATWFQISPRRVGFRPIIYSKDLCLTVKLIRKL